MNHHLAEYHVRADIEHIEVSGGARRARRLASLGVKRLGEIRIVGAAAAVANAIFAATGERVRNLPITLDKLLPA